MMCEGDKWELFIPYDLAYGERGSMPKIPPFSPLVFEMEIHKVRPHLRSFPFQLDLGRFVPKPCESTRYPNWAFPYCHFQLNFSIFEVRV